MLLSCRDPVKGIFEIGSQDGDVIILMNLLDDLEYLTCSNMGRAAFRSLPRGGFVHARLVPLDQLRGFSLLAAARPGAHAPTHARIRSFTAAGFSTCRKWPVPSTTSILDPAAR